MTLEKPEKYQNQILDEIDDKIKSVSQMSKKQRQFINGIIRQTKPKKILEVGVSSGASSAVILNAIKDIEGSQLYSIDVLDKYYYDNSKDIGFIVNESVPELSAKWKLYTGNVAAKFMEDIGGDIEVCLLDTMHCNPGEILDFLMIAPFLSKNSIVILHDIQLHVNSVFKADSFEKNIPYYTTLVLTTSLSGNKFYPDDDEHADLSVFNTPNISAIQLDKDNFNANCKDIFSLLTLHWNYMISDEHNKYIIKIFNKYYDKELVYLYNRIFYQNKLKFEKNKIIKEHIYEFQNLSERVEVLENNIYKLLERIINTLVWWIPFRNIRNKFRQKIWTGQDRTLTNILYDSNMFVII